MRLGSFAGGTRGQVGHGRLTGRIAIEMTLIGGRSVGGGLRRKAVKWLDLPDEVLMDVPRIDIVGHLQMRLVNHHGLKTFERERVVIRLGAGSVVVRGRDLVIGWIDREEILVTGVIFSIQFEGWLP